MLRSLMPRAAARAVIGPTTTEARAARLLIQRVPGSASKQALLQQTSVRAFSGAVTAGLTKSSPSSSTPRVAVGAGADSGE